LLPSIFGMGGNPMWVEGEQLQRLDSAFELGRTTDIDRLLDEIFASGGREGAAPTVCAVCRRDLIRGEFGRPGLVASTCPEGHGAWMSPDALGTLRRLADDHATNVRARRRITVLSAILALTLTALLVSASLTGGSIVPRWITAKPMTAVEQQYLGALLAVLKDGIGNRLNIEGVLKTDSEPETYAAVYEIYRRRAEDVIARLRALEAPERLRPVHDRIVRAAERQIEFYGDFTAARARDRSTDLARMLGHPALRESDYDLRTAWDLIRQTYPDLAPATLETIDTLLCQFDAI